MLREIVQTAGYSGDQILNNIQDITDPAAWLALYSCLQTTYNFEAIALSLAGLYTHTPAGP